MDTVDALAWTTTLAAFILFTVLVSFEAGVAAFVAAAGISWLTISRVP